MKNSSFSIRYLCQEILKIIVTCILIGSLEYITGNEGVAEFVLVVGVFFTIHKVTSIIKNVESDKDLNLKDVGFTWRFKRKMGVKLSKEAVKLHCRDEEGFNLMVIILFVLGFASNSLITTVALLISFQVVYSDSFGFLDKNFDNYYRFRGQCAGIIKINGSRSSQEFYFVSIVDYETKQELVVKVDREKMRYFKNGETIQVIYGKIGRKAVSIY